MLEPDPKGYNDVPQQSQEHYEEVYGHIRQMEQGLEELWKDDSFLKLVKKIPTHYKP